MRFQTLRRVCTRVCTRVVLCLLSVMVWGAPLTPEDWQALTKRVDALRVEASIPATALVIVERGAKPRVEVWGAKANTPFRVGSISKSFTALTLLDVMEELRLSPDTPVQDLIGDAYTNPYAPRHPVRIRHLLELTAGLTDLSGREFNDNTYFSLADALALNPNNRTLRWPPGQQHSYTNVAPGLTSLLIERLTKKPFETVASERVLRPLGMPRASYLPVDGLPGGFKADGKSEIPYWNVTYRAFGALNASPTEMARFLDALLAPDDVGPLNPRTRAAFFTPTSGLAAQAGVPVGYASGAYGWITKGHLFHGHGGDADGYRSRYGVLRDAGRSYFVVINTDNPAALRSMVRTVESFLVSDLSKPPKPPKPPTSSSTRPQNLAEFTGTFYPASVRFGQDRWLNGNAPRVTIQAARDAEQPVLRFKRRNRSTTLRPLGDGLFARPDDPLATVAFVWGSEGALHLQGELGNYFRLSPPCPEYVADAFSPDIGKVCAGSTR